MQLRPQRLDGQMCHHLVQQGARCHSSVHASRCSPPNKTDTRKMPRTVTHSTRTVEHNKYRSIFRNNNIESVEVGHVFGTPSVRNKYDVEALLRDPDCPPPFLKKEFLKWMSCLNQLRVQIKKMDVFKFDVKEFSKQVLYYDKVMICFVAMLMKVILLILF